MTNRSAKATLSPFELTALRHVANGREAEVQAEHLDLLLDMGLAGLGMNGRASLTSAGRQRLREARAKQGYPMTQDAALSPAEVNALRRVGHGLANFLPRAHRDRLVSLRLVTVNGGGRLVLTQVGKERLAEENAGGGSDNLTGGPQTMPALANIH